MLRPLEACRSLRNKIISIVSPPAADDALFFVRSGGMGVGDPNKDPNVGFSGMGIGCALRPSRMLDLLAFYNDYLGLSERYDSYHGYPLRCLAIE